MVTTFADCHEVRPAQVRGKTVYLQYSTRQEIVNSTRSAEQGGNVLLVSLENLTVRTARRSINLLSVCSPLQSFPSFRKLHHVESSPPETFCRYLGQGRSGSWQRKCCFNRHV
jgi:hypothetical protein